jgi:hypothetical protein
MIFLLMMIAVQGFMAGEYSIEDFQWKNRLILIGAIVNVAL